MSILKHGPDCPSVPVSQTGADEPALPARQASMDKRRRSHRRKRRGVAAVEFAVVAPTFFFLLLGMFEYGRMIMVQQMLTNAAREGARVAILDGATITAVQDSVDTYLASGVVSGADIEVMVDGTAVTDVGLASAGAGDPVTVSASIPFSDVSWLTPLYLGDTQLTSSSVMRRETNP